MNESLKLFIEKIIKEPEIAAKLAECKTPDEAYEVASSVQDGFTKEEFVEAMEKLNAVASGQELTDDDLAKLAGGDVDWEAIGITIAIGAPAGAVSGLVTLASTQAV